MATGTNTLIFPSGPVTLVNYDPGQTDTDSDGIPDWWQLLYYGTIMTNSFSCASCVDTNPWAYGLTNLQVYQNPSVLSANDYSTIGDGIPDWWRVKYFNSSTMTNGSSCATCDPDGDGYSNLDEFLMGTDPTNSTDPITIYVDASNFDTNTVPDGTQAHSFRQIQDAIDCTNVPPSGHLAIRVRPGICYEAPSNIRTTDSAERQFLYLYAANSDWSLSVDPERHVIDSLGVYVGVDSASFSPTIIFDPAVLQARVNGFTIRGGLGEVGGIECVSPSGTVVISNCIIDRNGQASSVAGGIYLDALTNSWIYNTVVANNLGEIGGILDVAGVRIWNCTIESNVTSISSVGGVYGDGYALSNLRNCITWANGFDLYNVDVDYSDVGVYDSNSVVYGAHNLTNDPIIVNIANANYRLQTNSPVFTGGTSLPIEQRDLYGNSRPLTGSFDIGANQYKDSLGSGMQDDWEIKNGLSLSVNQGTSDFDSDGLSNLQEYNLGTNPNNPDTDGDGIEDNLDPHPTTAELTIFTSFSDYFRLNAWALYVDGVTSNQWTYFPPFNPTKAVFKNRHVGDHINFQFELISYAIWTPIVPFLIPPQQFENMQYGCFTVVPDLNDAPAFVATMFPGVLSPPWYFTIAQTTPTNADVCAGFDDETPYFFHGSLPALSVPQDGTNTVNVVINPTNIASQIIFQSSNTNLAQVTPAQATGSPQLITVAGKSPANIITSAVVTVSGYGAQNSVTTECSQVAIDVLPKRTNVTVYISEVIALTFSNSPPTDAPSADDLKTYLDSVYGKQANVFITVVDNGYLPVNYDLNGNRGLDYSTNAITSEEAAILNTFYHVGAINVYYVNSLTNSQGLRDEGITIGVSSNRACFVQDLHNSSNVNVSAHEIGHALGLVHPDEPGKPVTGTLDRLMWTPDEGSNACRLVRDEWQTVNGNAK